MKIAILGYGEEGKAVFRYFRRKSDQRNNDAQQHTEITICDRKETLELPGGVRGQLGETYLQNLNDFDLVFRSPGIRPDTITNASPGLGEEKITTITNEFFKMSPSRNIIGVTGTKGKGTTTTLIARILEQIGERAHIGGNIGTPALDLFPDIQENDWIVLELSSFQLFDIHHSPHVAVCLMITSDHMDWHTDMEEYVEAKSNIATYQSNQDAIVFYGSNQYSSRIGNMSAGAKVPYYVSGEYTMEPGNYAAQVYIEDDYITFNGVPICHVDELGLRGPHNHQNACAAVGAVIMACHPGLISGSDRKPIIPEHTKTAIKTALTEFTGLEHRLEYVATKQGISFYNDSFSTNPVPTIAAIHSFSEPEILILGGSGKGADFSELSQEIVNSNVKHVVVIGDESSRITAALDSAEFANYSHGGETMPEMLNEALQHAEEGGVVLLSPACASFGLFESYKDRGKQFKEAIKKL